MSTSTRAVTSPVGRSLGSRRLKGALPSVTSLAPDHFTEPESPQGDASLNPLRAPRTCEKPVLRARRQKEGTATVQRVFLSVSPTRSAIASNSTDIYHYSTNVYFCYLSTRLYCSGETSNTHASNSISALLCHCECNDKYCICNDYVLSLDHVSII